MNNSVKKRGVLSDSPGQESQKKKTLRKANYTDQSVPNIGWLFYKNYYQGLQSNWLGSGISDTVKKEIKSNFDRKNDELLKARFDLSENIYNSLSNVKIDLKTII